MLLYLYANERVDYRTADNHYHFNGIYCTAAVGHSISLICTDLEESVFSIICKLLLLLLLLFILQPEQDRGRSTRRKWMEPSGLWPVIHYERQDITQDKSLLEVSLVTLHYL